LGIVFVSGQRCPGSHGDAALHAHLFSPNVALTQGDGALFDCDGWALIVHAKADDYQSQPAGDAGD